MLQQDGIYNLNNGTFHYTIVIVLKKQFCFTFYIYTPLYPTNYKLYYFETQNLTLINKIQQDKMQHLIEYKHCVHILDF